jgi:hypothetical protein
MPGTPPTASSFPLRLRKRSNVAALREFNRNATPAGRWRRCCGNAASAALVPDRLRETLLWRMVSTAPPPQSQRPAGSLRVDDALRAAPPRRRSHGRTVEPPVGGPDRCSRQDARLGGSGGGADGMAGWASDRRTCGSRSVDPDCGRFEMCEIKERRYRSPGTL